MIADFKKKNKNQRQKFDRITLLRVLFFVLAFLMIARMAYLQIFKHEYYQVLANKRHITNEKIEPERGKIYTKDFSSENDKLYPLAINQKLYLLYGVPAVIVNASSTVEQIAGVISLEEKDKIEMVLKLQKQDPYEPLKHYLELEQKEKIEALKIKGLGFTEEVKRIYPQNNLFAQVLGFVGYKEDKRVGQYGLEEQYQKYLSGQGGVLKQEKDPQGRIMAIDSLEASPIIDGNDLVLTLDPAVQLQTCNTLKKWIEKMAATDGVAIVLEPFSGSIMAMCNYPDFDLNSYNKVENVDIYTNSAISESYEPGSVFKAVTMAIALDIESVTSETRYTDEGFLKFGPDIIKNAQDKKYGNVDMTSVLENSINTGAIFAALKTGKETFKKYVEKFGFGSLTNIDLPHEAKGDLKSLDSNKDIYTATASYGQGIMTTPLQMIMAYGALVNGGMLMQPQIILEKRFFNGKIEQVLPTEVRRVISSKTSNVIKAMLASVVKNGHAKGAQIPGFYVGGKTGTANIAGQGGYTTDTIHTFIGFAPLEKPKFVVLVKITKPRNALFAEGSVVPAFAEITKFLLNYYQIKPEY